MANYKLGQSFIAKIGGIPKEAKNRPIGKGTNEFAILFSTHRSYAWGSGLLRSTPCNFYVSSHACA